MGKRTSAMKDETRRSRIRQMISAGYTNAKIAKELGISYVHAARLAEQERAELAKDGA